MERKGKERNGMGWDGVGWDGMGWDKDDDDGEVEWTVDSR